MPSNTPFNTWITNLFQYYQAQNYPAAVTFSEFLLAVHLWVLVSSSAGQTGGFTVSIPPGM